MKSALVKPHYVWLADFVYGGIDGAVTTFAVVAGVQGAQLAISIVLILGFANLFADGFSMAVGKYSSDKAEKDRIQKIRRLEYEAVEQQPQEEIAEVKELLRRQGFRDHNLDQAVQVITSDKDRWVEFMMKHEFEVVEEAIYPVKSAATTLAAFMIIGFIPMVGYVFSPMLPYTANGVFYLTSTFTFLALFIVGAVKALFTDRPWWLSGLTTVAIGGIAATIAYFVGFGLRDITGL